jgi:BMFP domain-containing protein YqiC
MKKKRDEKEELKQYIAFLEKRLASKNFKANVTAEDYKKTKDQLSKARFRLKLLK